MKKFFIVILLLSIIFIVTPVTYAQDRFATCDLCGFCPPNQPPSTWGTCRSCIYENANPDPLSQDTLKIDPTTNAAPTPIPGRWYTMIGCISTNLGGFTQKGAAINVTQTLLNIIFSFAGGIALLYLIYGSFLIITSHAEVERLNEGKRVVLGAIIGVIFTLFSVFIVSLIATGILHLPGTSISP